MTDTKGERKGHYKNFLLSIFDLWSLLNEEIPKRIEDEKILNEIQEERRKKLGYRGSDKEKIFSSTEIAIINELISNPRKSFVKISSNLGLSRHTVKKRIEEMLKFDKIIFYVGLNHKKLNIDLVVLTLNTVNIKYLDEIFQEYQKCPRVFSIIKDISKSCLQILFGIEKGNNSTSNRCVNMIERIQLDERVKECVINYLYPKIFPEFFLFTPKNIPKQSSISPCEINCSLCEKYINKKCDGCPATALFRGNIFNKP
ncbi:MAG: AsnC family transcriptional regulator [Promethearchaeota archaeon]